MHCQSYPLVLRHKCLRLVPVCPFLFLRPVLFVFRRFINLQESKRGKIEKDVSFPETYDLLMLFVY
jgi:hypothetical protein